jgi:hypothetical protein
MVLIGVIFLALWMAGLTTSHTLGGFIHAFLVLAVITFLCRMVHVSDSKTLAEMRAAAPQAGNLAIGASLARGLVEHSCPCCLREPDAA